MFGPIAQLKQQLANQIDWLSHYGADSEGGVTRLLYSPAWVNAQNGLAQRMREAGLDTYYDDAGNLYGRLEGTEQPEAVVLTGSHIDTVRSGGKYDGAAGILAGLSCLRQLYEQYGRPKRTLEIVSLCEEEGSRFPVTFWGSGNMTGRWSMSRIPEVSDIEGIPLAHAMADAGFGLGTHRPCRRQDLIAFIELHIEQGMVLERLGRPIGIVQGIVGQVRLTFEVCGETNHAGTTQMGWRKDAVAGMAEMALALEQEAKAAGDPYVATVGKIVVTPNVSNVIAGNVLFTVDLRHPNAFSLETFARQVVERFYSIASDRSLQLSHRQWMHAEPVPMNDALIRELEQTCQSLQVSYHAIHSGAGHDAQLLSAICPSAMLFVPSRAGISHSPDEYTSAQDLALATIVLADTLHRLAYGN
ncbi:allantoate deiminase [Paenibacillus sp. MMS18-CY102]|uniref:allantoate deiminase n=1 Tax=Paenibacillus sp. MMS18-CY102 TaxID=2682849 RepID=UPI001365C6F8|nr:allantoate deiminase [Paenibacillus sp. MMS18-CY102]MWC28715.1 allantoate deiminase [Paenibacillus sp. MMS18-CY102]